MNVFASALKTGKSSFQIPWKLETAWKLDLNKINTLSLIPVSNWKLDLETWKLEMPHLFQCVIGEFQFPVFLLPLKGLGVVASAYAWPTPHCVAGHHLTTHPKNRVAMHPAKNAIATLTTPQAMEKRYG